MTAPTISTPMTKARPQRSGVLGRFLRNGLAMSALVLLVIIVVIAIISPWIAPQNPMLANPLDANQGPNAAHLLGTDGSGRDLLSRLLIASRVTLLGGLIAVVTAALLGIPTGLAAGYFQKWFESVGTWVSSVLLALPHMIVLLSVIASFGSSLGPTMIAFGVMLSPGFYRVVRGQVLAVRNELYIDAARVSGLPDTRIIGRHVLGVVRAPIIIQAAIIAGQGIIIQAGLEFLGFGDATTPTWGGMLGEAFTVIYLDPTAVIWPGLAIAITVACLILIANGIRDALQSTSRAVRNVDLRQKNRVKAVPATAYLSVQHVRIAYPNSDGTPNVVVHDVSFDVLPGEVLGIVGESGSGKTQTAFSVLGLLPRGGQVIDGRILIDSVDITDLPVRKRRALLGKSIGYVPQEPMSNLDPAFTIGDQLVEPLRRNLRLSKREAKKRALALLDRVGIVNPERTFRSYPHQISGGMAQRVLIAGAVSCRPKLLIADEPTTALDVTVQAEVLDLLRELQSELSMAVVLVTHNFGVVADICDRVVVMQSGRVVESAETEELFANPANSYTRTLLASTLDDAPSRAALQTAPRSAL